MQGEQHSNTDGCGNDRTQFCKKLELNCLSRNNCTPFFWDLPYPFPFNSIKLSNRCRQPITFPDADRMHATPSASGMAARFLCRWPTSNFLTHTAFCTSYVSRETFYRPYSFLKRVCIESLLARPEGDSGLGFYFNMGSRGFRFAARRISFPKITRL